MRRRWDEQPAPPSRFTGGQPRHRLGLRRLMAVPYRGGDSRMLQRAGAHASEVADLTEPERADLLERLDGWWPARSMRSGVKVRGPSSWSIPTGANAWLRYGPPLDAPLSPMRWAAIALMPIPHGDDTIEWLQRHYAPEADPLCIAAPPTAANAWCNLLLAMPMPAPAPVLESLERDWTPASESVEAIERLARVLRETGQSRVLGRLARRDPSLGHGLRFELAAAGDASMQRRLLEQMERDLRGGRSYGRASVIWLAAVTTAELLDPLFAALEACHRHGLEGIEFYDLVEPLHAAIRRIGGADAIHGYERLIVEGDQPFLRHRRDEIEQDLLGAASRAVTPALLAGLGLPGD